MKDELISKVMDEVMKKMGASTRLPPPPPRAAAMPARTAT